MQYESLNKESWIDVKLPHYVDFIGVDAINIVSG
jgi:hypothetical protein